MRKLAHFKWPAFLFVMGILLGFLPTGILILAAAPTDAPILVPGETTINVASAGKYVLWEETPASGEATDHELWPEGSEFAVLDSSGRQLVLRDVLAESSSIYGFTFGDRLLMPTMFVEIEQRGAYRFFGKGFSERRIYHLKRAFPQWLFTASWTISTGGLILAGLGLLLAALVGVKLLLHKAAPIPE